MSMDLAAVSTSGSLTAPFPIGNLSFHPSKEGFANAESIVSGFQAAYSEAAGKVAEFLPPLRFPTVTMVAPDHEARYRQENGIPSWADAYSSGGEIFICSPLSLNALVPVLAHEIFHFCVTGYSAHRPCLPDWFNESLAYLVQGEMGIDHRKIRFYLKHDSELVIPLILEDRISELSSFSVPLVKALGRYLLQQSPSGTLSGILAHAFRTADFHASMVSNLGKSPKDLVEGWLAHLGMEENAHFYEDPIRYVA